ncbi:FAD-binding and (Fe-S)-binding domain-containing protein [Fangia hongkongensis]|uniref:FAD-binding and (Fe-S)-binding domain-containing protein n=1 Tax=Fangia hongkongensis TaxID=270495 RepID=UPI000360C7DA|nr:FAD-binding and (Fe-S)-binding domain-containing protein [Fangia hongkongensis]MBK2123941.1 FAD-binding oxidoreductase [Fangia hongkongensis]
MLPRLSQLGKLDHIYEQFILELKGNGFRGDIQQDYASRMAGAVDNSIYQVVPALMLFPKTTDDIKCIFALAGEKAFSEIRFSARGAGTGTNGQSLCSGVLVDSTRYLNNILEINEKERYAIVEPGVVLDQLNDKLKEKGLFFAPSLSPSNRATIGGMASTDACGKGSRIYGRTSEHLLELECILSNGQSITTKPLPLDHLSEQIEDGQFIQHIYDTVQREVVEQYDLIEAQFPKLDRFMTGYNLAKCYDKDKKILNLSYLISGSEGTLVYISALKLKLTELPKKKRLFAISYTSFERALLDAKKLLSYDPAAIETVDDNILMLAKKDEIYPSIAHMIEIDSAVDVKAINLVEFIAGSDSLLNEQTDALKVALKNTQEAFYIADTESEIEKLWDLRKKGVGLLGAMAGHRKPVPFMEDTAVPPENLAEYIVELRALLDSYNLKYGMFGHVDVGCLHMRPALDMNSQTDRKLVVELTYKVNELVRKYGGVYWSEHGKGFRSEYVKEYFGERLNDSLSKIKKAFDPYNQLNPGKIVTPFQSVEELVKVDGPFRGIQDDKVKQDLRDAYSGAFNCNGNAACLNYDVNHVMCPSAKASRDWVNSPKGRSILLREWLRQLSENNMMFSAERGSKGREISGTEKSNFSSEVYQSLNKCLGCKACATACPIKVDIPTMKAKFLSRYHAHYKRPFKDYAVKNSEKIAKLTSYMPRFVNKVQSLSLAKHLIRKKMHMVDMPKLSSPTLKAKLKGESAFVSNVASLGSAKGEKRVCIVQDAFSSFYDASVVHSVYQLLKALGYKVAILPFHENGKPQHVKGFLTAFENQAKRNISWLTKVADSGIPMIGIDPSMTLTYRDEYKPYTKGKDAFKVQLFQEWFVTELANIDLSHYDLPVNEVFLMAHCSERALAAVSMVAWQKIFKVFNQNLSIEKVGCCGMAGTFGHEVENYDMSKIIYGQSWQPHLKAAKGKVFLATGFSCRSQVKRFDGIRIDHPFEYLYKLIKNSLQ